MIGGNVVAKELQVFRVERPEIVATAISLKEQRESERAGFWPDDVPIDVGFRASAVGADEAFVGAGHRRALRAVGARHQNAVNERVDAGEVVRERVINH